MGTITGDHVVGIILNPANQVLLQRKDSTYDWWPGYWCTFGGGVEEGESLESALVREIDEETGLSLSDIKYFMEQSFSEQTKQGPFKKRSGTIHYFSAKFDGDLSMIVLGEGAGFSIFDERELDGYNDLGIVVPKNYEAIKEFYESLRAP